MSNTHEAQSAMTKQDTLPPLPTAKHFYYAEDDARAVRKPLDLFTTDQLRDYARAALAAQAPQQAQGVPAPDEIERAAHICRQFDTDAMDEVAAMLRKLSGILHSVAAPQAAPAPQALTANQMYEEGRDGVTARIQEAQALADAARSAASAGGEG